MEMDLVISEAARRRSETSRSSHSKTSCVKVMLTCTVTSSIAESDLFLWYLGDVDKSTFEAARPVCVKRQSHQTWASLKTKIFAYSVSATLK
jgi:hypothetical protein